MFYGEALPLALKIWNSYQKSSQEASSVVVFGVIHQNSKLLRSLVIQNDLSPFRMQRPSEYIAAVRIPLSPLQTVEQIAEILLEFRAESLEDDYFLVFEPKHQVTAFHFQSEVLYNDMIFPVIFRYRNENDEPENLRYPDRGIVDIVFHKDATSHSVVNRLKRAIQLVYGSQDK